MTKTTSGTLRGRRTSLLVRLLEAAPGLWVVKGGYANQLRRPDDARFTEDLDLKLDAAIETAPEFLVSGFAVDLDDDFSYEVASPPAPLGGPPGGGLRFFVGARLADTDLVRFKVDVSAADVVVGDFESYRPGRASPRPGHGSLLVPLHSQDIACPGACRKTLVARQNCRSCPQTWCNSGAVNENGHRVILASLE